MPFAFCLARLPIGGKPALLALAALPLVLPSFVGAYALVLLFGRSGIVTGACSRSAFRSTRSTARRASSLVYTLTLYPYVVLPVTAAFKSVDISVEEAAQNLGASRARMLRTVTLPLVLPSILAGGLLVFIEALENFGVPFVLAEDRPILSVEAYKLFVGETDRQSGLRRRARRAAGRLHDRRAADPARRAGAPPLRDRRAPLRAADCRSSPALRRLGAAYCWIVVAAALVPFAAVVVISFMEFSGPVLHAGFSTDNFAQLFERSYRPLTNTLLLATPRGLRRDPDRRPDRLCHRAPSLAALGADRHRGDVAVRGRRNRARHRPGHVLFNSGFLVLTGSWLIIVLAYMVRKLPFSVRSAGAILHQIDPSLEEASINLGVPPLLTFLRITVPLMLGGIVGGFVLTFVTVASELSSTVVLYSGPWTTMTVAMFQALEGTSAGIAAAAATVLIICTVLPVALVYRLLRRHELSML